MMRVKYIGESFGVDSLTSGKVYECLGIEHEAALRIIDDSEEDYLYSALNPRPARMDDPCPGGRWEIVEDDEKGTLTKLFQKYNLI